MSKITQARLKQVLTYNLVSGTFTWNGMNPRQPKGRRAGTIDKRGYRRIQIDQEIVRAHRLAFLYVTGAMPQTIDHKNGILDDNSFDNLRSSTRSQNIANSQRRRDNTSGFKGVSAFGERWRASIGVDGRRVFLGVFDTAEMAHSAYIAAAQKFHGEFARAA